MKEVYDKIYGHYNEILKIPMDSPKYFELYKEYIKLLILVSSNNPSFNDDVKKYITELEQKLINSLEEGTIINIRQVDFGGLKLENVRASVVRNQKAPLLLGQSVLARLGKIEIDNSKHLLKITHTK